MPRTGLSPAEIDRYLGVLGVPGREPSRAALDHLVAAHLIRVPFENLSKVFRYRRLGLVRLPPLELFLDGIERDHLGGTCYANNSHFWSLLVGLGYRARLCGADMARPDVHLVIMVELEDREVLVDVGYGAPFRSALPLDLDQDLEIAWGRERYLLRPRDPLGCSRLDLYRDGVLRHGYTAKPAAREPDYFWQASVDSFRPDSVFMNTFLLRRYDPDRCLAIQNRRLVESTADSVQVRELADEAELVSVAQDRFGVPAEIVTEVLSVVGAAADPWG